MNRPKRGGRIGSTGTKGRASIDISGVLGGIGAEGDAAANPAFQNPGQVDYNYEGMPETSSQFKEPLVGKQSLLQKLRGQPSLGQQLNAKYLTDMAQLQGVNAMELKNAPQIDPNYIRSPLTQSSSQGSSPLSNEEFMKLPYSMQGDKQLGGDNSLRLPFSSGKNASLGSIKGNAEILTHRAQQLADAEAAGYKERNMLEARGGQPGITEPQLTQQNYWAGKGFNPAFSAQGGSLLGQSFPQEQALRDENTTQALREANIVKNIPQDQFTPIFSNSVLDSLKKQRILNTRLQDINVPANSTVVTPNKIYHGQAIERSEVPEYLTDAKSGLKIPTGKKTEKWDTKPFFQEDVITDPNTSPPTNKDAIQPTVSGGQTNNQVSPFTRKLFGRDSSLQAPDNQLQNPFASPDQNQYIYQLLLKKLMGQE